MLSNFWQIKIRVYMPYMVCMVCTYIKKNACIYIYIYHYTSVCADSCTGSVGLKRGLDTILCNRQRKNWGNLNLVIDSRWVKPPKKASQVIKHSKYSNQICLKTGPVQHMLFSATSSLVFLKFPDTQKKNMFNDVLQTLIQIKYSFAVWVLWTSVHWSIYLTYTQHLPKWMLIDVDIHVDSF